MEFMTHSISWLWDRFMEPWQFAFMQRGLIAALLIGISCAAIGTHVVLRKLSFIGDGLAHATFGGLAAGFLLKINAFVAALIVAVLTALAIGGVSRRAELSLDTAIGILFSGVFAGGIVIISHDRNCRGDLFDLLVGNVLTVSWSDLLMLAMTAVLVIGCILIFYKELLFTSFDPQGAQASGIPVGWLDMGLLCLLALTITVSLKTVGVILVSALLVTPAASAWQLTNSFPRMILWSCFLGVVSGVIGIYLSYYLDVPAGAAIVLTATALFFASVLVSPRRKPVKLAEEKVVIHASEPHGDYHPIG